MITTLYCIHCERMVLASVDFAGRLYHSHTVQINRSPDPGDRYDVVECEFPDGVAACPPPVFDLEEYADSQPFVPQLCTV